MTANAFGTPNNIAAVWVDRSFTLVVWLLGCLALFSPLFIIGFLFIKGAHVISWEFLTESPKGFPLGMSGGIWPAVEGSLALVGIGLLLAFPLGVFSGIYLVEYGESMLFNKTVRFASECLAAIPSMVYGIFGYSFLVVFFTMKISLLTGGFTLAFIMFPVILIGTEESMKAVEWKYREASLSMGVTKVYMVRKIILCKAWPGILAVTVLTAGHAFGSAAPILYTASVIFKREGLALNEPVMTLPTHLYYLVAEAVSFEHAYGTALILISILLCVNVIVMSLKNLMRK